MRRSTIMNFDRLLSQYNIYKTLSWKEKTQWLSNLEKVCINDSIQKFEEKNLLPSWSDELFVRKYKRACVKIATNIDSSSNNPGKNDNFVRKVLMKKIKIDEIQDMNFVELCPEKNADLAKKIDVSRNIELTLKVTNRYTCKICKGNRFIEEIEQTRCFDEGKATRAYCVTCMS